MPISVIFRLACRLTATLSLVWLPGRVPAQVPVTLYASPDGDGKECSETHPCSIYGAQEKVRTLNREMLAGITVFLRGGDYRLSRTWAFGVEDAGHNGFYVRYKAYPGETPRLGGGQSITGWSAAGNGIYRASVGMLRFRQLYVNGRRATRARFPNQGSFFQLRSWDEAGKKMIVNGSDLPGPLSEANPVEMVITRGWEWTRMRIAGIEDQPGAAAVVVAQPERSRVFGAQDFLRFANQSYYYENAFRFLDTAGEWFLDAGTGTLYYKPLPCEDLSAALAVAPVLETLLDVRGRVADSGEITPVKNLRFEGLTFEYTSWLLPSREGYFGEQAGSYFTGTEEVSTVPGGIRVEAAEGIELRENCVRHQAGDGISLGGFNRANRLTGNVVYDVGCNGISLNRPARPEAVSRSERVLNNYITRVAREFSGAGIFAAYAQDLLVAHNEIFDVPYSGISVGWGWTDALTSLRDNTIRDNHVHHAMRELSDGGGIYLLSRQPGTLVSGNYLHDIFRSPWAQPWPAAGIYLDNGSSLLTVENNVIERVQDPLYVQVYGLPAYDNTIRGTPADPEGVKARAGLEPEYRRVLREAAGDYALLHCGVPAAGTGLSAEYFSAPDLAEPALTRLDPFVDWGYPGDTAGIAKASARWTGLLEPRFPETYTLYLTTRSGARLWVDDRLLLEKPSHGGETTFTARIALQAGEKYPVRLECYNGAGARLEWSGPSQFREVIPQSQWYPPTARVVSFSLAYADTGQPVPGYDPIGDGDTVAAYSRDGRRLTILANTRPAGPGSVRFLLDGNAFPAPETAPFALPQPPGRDDPLNQPGVHVLTAVPYAGPGASGPRGIGRTIRFVVSPGAVAPRNGVSAGMQARLSPNPARGEARLVFYAAGGEQRILEITDLYGKIVQSGTFTTRYGKNELRIATAPFPGGVYLVKLAGGEPPVVIRLVKL